MSVHRNLISCLVTGPLIMNRPAFADFTHPPTQFNRTLFALLISLLHPLNYLSEHNCKTMKTRRPESLWITNQSN